MPRRCTVCCHPEREAIDRALVSGQAGYRILGDRYGISRSALLRHRKSHLAAQLADTEGVSPNPAKAPPEAAAVGDPGQSDRKSETAFQGLDVVQQLKAINAACLEVLKTARAERQPRTLLQAVDRICRQIQLQARLLTDLQEHKEVNVVLLPEWQTLRMTLLSALQPFPEARTAVLEALRDAGA